MVESIRGLSRQEKEELSIGAKLVIYDACGVAEKGIREVAEVLDYFEKRLHEYADVLARKGYDLMGQWRAQEPQ